MVKAIIFDLDGTLCNTVEDIRTGLNAMLTKLGYKTRSRADVIKFINNGARTLVRRALPKEVQGVEFIVDSALEVYASEYSKCYCEFTEAYNGIEYMLAELKRKGYKLAVFSNKQDGFVKDIVSRLFNKKLFSEILGQGSFPTKPDPTGAHYIAKQLGVKLSSCVYVGDSDVDFKTAQNADMEFIGCDWGYRGEEFLRAAGAVRIAKRPEDIIEHISLIELEEQRLREEKKRAKRNKGAKAKDTEDEVLKAQTLPEENAENDNEDVPKDDTDISDIQNDDTASEQSENEDKGEE
ncbi:MAG: HAD family hydrolase [Clostridia bacterium]|nr:HAD family hydrolase [Clostridia bacterium]